TVRNRWVFRGLDRDLTLSDAFELGRAKGGIFYHDGRYLHRWRRPCASEAFVSSCGQRMSLKSCAYKRLVALYRLLLRRLAEMQSAPTPGHYLRCHIELLQ